MHWLTKYTNKKCHAHSDMHSIPWPHYSAMCHPYISSSKFSATATYVGMVEGSSHLHFGTNRCVQLKDFQLCQDQWRHRRKLFLPERCRLTDNNVEKLINIKCNAALTKLQGIKFKQSLKSIYKQQTMHDSMYN